MPMPKARASGRGKMPRIFMNGQAAAYSSRCRIQGSVTLSPPKTCVKRMEPAHRARSVSTLKKLRVVLRKYRSQSSGRSLGQGVDFLNQSIDIRGHDQQISQSLGPRIPIRVRSSSRHKNARARTSLDFIVAGANPQGPLDHVPYFIVGVMKMQWCDEARRSGRTTRVLPFD